MKGSIQALRPLLLHLLSCAGSTARCSAARARPNPCPPRASACSRPPCPACPLPPAMTRRPARPTSHRPCPSSSKSRIRTSSVKQTDFTPLRMSSGALRLTALFLCLWAQVWDAHLHEVALHVAGRLQAGRALPQHHLPYLVGASLSPIEPIIFVYMSNCPRAGFPCKARV